MAITTNCPTCQALFRLPLELAGRQVRCQSCQNVFTVPQASADEPTSSSLDASSLSSSPPSRNLGNESSQSANDSEAATLEHSQEEAKPFAPSDSSSGANEAIPVVLLAEGEDVSIREPGRRRARWEEEDDDVDISLKRSGRGRRGSSGSRPSVAASTPVRILAACAAAIITGGAIVAGVVGISDEMNRIPQNFIRPPIVGPVIFGGPAMPPPPGLIGGPPPPLNPAGAIRAQLDEKNAVQVVNSLDLQDPFFPGRGRYKELVVKLENGRTYILDLIAVGQGDMYLFVRDDTGAVLASDDDSGGNLNSRIQFTAQKTGDHYLDVTTFGPTNLRTNFRLVVREAGAPAPPDVRPLANVGAVPKATNANKTLEGEEIPAEPGIIARRFDIRTRPLVGNVLWAKDGKSFYVASGQGHIRRIRLEGFVEERQIHLRQPVTHLTQSSEGIVATIGGIQEAWVLDPQTLDLRGRRMNLAGKQRLTTGSESKFGFAAGVGPGGFNPRPFNNGGNLSQGILAVDLAAGVPLNEYSLPASQVACSPDGKTIYADVGNSAGIRRYDFDGKLLKQTSSGPAVAAIVNDIVVSSDGKYQAFLSITGNRENVFGGKGRLNGHGFYVFSGDLSKPICSVSPGPNCCRLAFDVVDHSIVTHSFHDVLQIFDLKGNLKYSKLVHEPQPPTSVVDIAVHPDGRRALYLGTGEIRYFDWSVLGKAPE